MNKYHCFTDKYARVCYRKANAEDFIDLSILTSNELEQFESFKNEKRRQLFYALRLIARKEGIKEIFYDDNGKPLCDGCFISISHSGDWVGLAIAVNPVGIDIEGVNEKILKIKDRFLDLEEQEVICENDLRKMTLCWSAKEAVFKIVGGETTFFKTNQKVIEIRDEFMSLEYINKNEKKQVQLKIKSLDDKFNLVYTM